MRRIRLEEVRPGMVVATPVYSTDGKILLAKDSQLNESMIDRLAQLKLGSLFVKDLLPDLEIPGIISEKTRTAAAKNLNEAISSYLKKGTINMAEMRKIASMIVDDVHDNRQQLIHSEDIRTYDDYLLFHSIYVATYAVKTGMTLGYTESNLMDLCLGCLMHDIGMMVMDASILNKPGELNEQEIQMVRQHAEDGFNIIRKYSELPPTASNIAYQHHEKVDGSGYPRGLKGDQILDYSKIAAVADTFDAIVADRPYRRGYSAPDASIILRKLVGTFFEPEMAAAFIYNIAVYPIGSLVVLNNGCIAQVRHCTQAAMKYPRVYVFMNDHQRMLRDPYDLDTGGGGKIQVVKRLSAEESNKILDKLTIIK